jgi:DNA-binding transcriptional ArsR family regulator
MRSEAPPLLPILRSRHQGELLAVLLLHPDREYTLSDLSRRLNVPLSTLQGEANRLIDAGLVRQRRLGRARVLRAELANRYSRPLTELVTLAFGPHLVVEEELGLVAGLEAALIYGSWAARYQGEAGPPPNDLDLLVIGQPDRTQLYEAADRAERRLDLPINPAVRGRRRWDAAADPLVRQVKSSPVVWVLDRANLQGAA